MVKDIKNLEDLFDSRSLVRNHDLFNNKIKTVIEKFETKTPKNIFIDESVCLRSKMKAFKCGNDSKNKMKGIQKSHS